MRYTRRADHETTGLAFTHQFSRDLDAFENSAEAVEVIASGTGDDGIPVEAVQVRLPLVLSQSGGKARLGRSEV
jgi:hypothetical protein